ncbi:ABC-2 type transporter [Thermogladius calderae 1633]|uniref:ABC-2 type transporter n=1 Tax=Thermogladius calderae (strain DSM 22663 / VKM B-2946 / 1633) TaxID=1184251 RepID=I3TFI6_THEC1|nr:ABC transporter permease [Thermogladius calderae]AFK51524.1 ABC-2 type transporter [Thermogladius calderae 1633]
MRPRAVEVVVWKELLDLWRDKKTLFAAILLPVVSMPLIGLTVLLLSTQQPVNVAIVDMDNTTYSNPTLNVTVSSEWLVGNLTRALAATGCNVHAYTYEPGNLTLYDLVVVVPKWFSRNATSLTEQARVEIIRKASVQPALNAENTVLSTLSQFSRNLSEVKVGQLALMSGLGPGSFSVDSILQPVVAGPIIVITPSGAPASPLEQIKPFIAKVLILGLIFVVSPASMYVVDGIVGERERKTIELLLATPLGVSEVITGKLIAASILGLVSSLSDVASLMVYMYLIALSVGGFFWLVIDLKLVLLHAVTAFFTILVTVAIATPFVTRTQGVRSASNIATMVNMIGMALFFSGFMIDYPKIEPSILYPLMVLPYTHSILVIQDYVYGMVYYSMLHLAVLVAVSILLLYVGVKSVSPEKILLAK